MRIGFDLTPVTPMEAFEKALDEYRLWLIGTLTEIGKVDQLEAARSMDAARA